MDVYVEIVIIDNFVLTYCLGALTYRVTLKRVNKTRCAVASLIGTIVAVFYPFISNNLVVFAVKIALWIILSVILFARKERFFMGAIVFLGLTFLFGGLLFGVSLAISGNVNASLRGNVTVIPWSLIVLCFFVGDYLVKKIALSVRACRDVSKSVYEFKIKVLGKEKIMRGFMDTGNRLYDERNGLPVVVISAKSIQDLLTDEQIGLLALGQGERIQRNARYVKFSALGGQKKKILLLRPDEFILYFEDKGNIFYDVTVGVILSPIRDSVNYDAILHPALVTGGNNV